jgi:putative transposase
MIDRTHELSITRQAQLVGISRGTVYYLPQPVSPEDLSSLMRRIDELHLEYPWAGARRLRDWLQREGHAVGRKHVRTLTQRMGIEPLYRKPNTSKRHPGHKIYPYLLRNVAITAPNQAWAMDITYIPMAHGFVYLAAVMDWYSRKVLAWRLSNSMESSFCIEAVEEAIANFGTQAIFNTDQGCQSTSIAFWVANCKYGVKCRTKYFNSVCYKNGSEIHKISTVHRNISAGDEA